MIDHRFVKMVERVGYVNKAGKRIYGTAALLHYLNLHVNDLDQNNVALGKTFVNELLYA